jgi:Tfp pilus assembly protein PilF
MIASAPAARRRPHSSHRRWLCLAGLWLACGAAAAPAPAPGLAGSVSCRECHSKFYELWAPSHHGLAMQPYSIARTNLTEQKTALQIGPHRYRADIKNAVVIEQGPGGEKRYPMQEALGGKNVLYFLTPTERGRLQVLPVAYDLNRKEWYDTTGSAVRHFGMRTDEAIDWHETPLTFNTSCYNCHVSQLARNYDLKTDTYHTAWAEPGINCETCHGPSAEHVKAARAATKEKPLTEVKLIRTKPFSAEQMNSLCESCHAKMMPVTSSFKPGDRFFDHFGLAALEQNDFYPDGRDLGENFTMTSWRLSPCAQSGKLSCIACHTSSGRYRFRDPAKATEACLPCHEPNVKNLPQHSHHPPGTNSPTCISCHMPMTEFARMRRSDHSMRPPMPAATAAYGSPNACNLCHTNKSAAWADRLVREWKPRDYQAPVLQRAALIAAARKHDWSRLPDMLKYLAGPGREEIWAASLIELLRTCDQEAKWNVIEACLKDQSPLVRAAAAEALGDGLRPETLPALLAATRDDYRLVRVRAAAALAVVPREGLAEADRKSLDAASEELLASFVARPDESTAHYNLGNFYMERHQYDRAIAAFETATRLQPDSLPPLVNVAMAYNLSGENEKAEASLRRAVRLDATNAAVNLNLGMLLAEMDKLPEAERAFRTAFKADPRSAQTAYNLGVLLTKDRPAEGLDWCRRAADLRPQEPKYAYTLAFFQQQQGQAADAIATLEKLLQSAPPHPDSYVLLAKLYGQAGKATEAASVYRRAAANEKLPAELRAAFRSRAGAVSP